MEIFTYRLLREYLWVLLGSLVFKASKPSPYSLAYSTICSHLTDLTETDRFTDCPGYYCIRSTISSHLTDMRTTDQYLWVLLL